MQDHCICVFVILYLYMGATIFTNFDWNWLSLMLMMMKIFNWAPGWHHQKNKTLLKKVIVDIFVKKFYIVYRIWCMIFGPKYKGSYYYYIWQFPLTFSFAPPALGKLTTSFGEKCQLFASLATDILRHQSASRLLTWHLLELIQPFGVFFWKNERKEILFTSILKSLLIPITLSTKIKYFQYPIFIYTLLIVTLLYPVSLLSGWWSSQKSK